MDQYARWSLVHGEFFLIQEEKARPGGTVFDTLSVMGVNSEKHGYFARAFEHHGFYRHYDVTVDGKVWTISDETERATIEFSGDNRTLRLHRSVSHGVGVTIRARRRTLQLPTKVDP